MRILADAKSQDAALAEVEVLTYSENLAMGLTHRGGRTDDQGVTGRASNMIDGNVNTTLDRTYAASQNLGLEEIRYDWDLGAVYWITRALFVSGTGNRAWGIASPRILSSDGRLLPSLPAPGEGSAIDYDLLFDYVPDAEWKRRPDHLIYLLQPYRKIRHLAMTFQIGDNRWGGVGALAEVAFFATGHVGEVTMSSGFIEVANRPKILETLTWEADLPPDTRIQANTRSGNTFVTRTRYYDRSGNEVSADSYENMRRSKRGNIVEVVETGDDWSPWSVPYQFSGQRFLSPSPRQFVQLRLNLSSNRPEVAPTLRAVSLEFADAILTEATGEIIPKQAAPGVAQTFTYTLTPTFRSGDPGFDRILVEMPAMGHRDSLAVRIGGVPIKTFQVSMVQDSLVLQLSEVVKRDQMEIDIHVPVSGKSLRV